DELSALTKKEFDYEDEEEVKPPKKKTPAMEGGDQTVTPARSQQPAPAKNGISGNKITLTPDERAMAWSIADSGAYRDPKTGKNPTRAEAEVRYARALYKDRIAQQQRGA